MECKLIYNKKNCIGAGECEAISPHLWKMNSEGKADLLKAKEISKGIFELEITEQEYKKQQDVVASCPIGCIKLEKK